MKPVVMVPKGSGVTREDLLDYEVVFYNPTLPPPKFLDHSVTSDLERDAAIWGELTTSKRRLNAIEGKFEKLERMYSLSIVLVGILILVAILSVVHSMSVPVP